MDWFVFCDYIKEHLNWVIPSITSLLFALVTTILICKQAKWQKNERKINAEFMAHQNNLQATQICISLLANRLRIHDGILTSLSVVAQKNTVTNADLIDLLSRKKGVKYLFGEDVNNYCERIFDTYRKIIRTESYLLSSEAKTNQQYLESMQEEKHKLMDEILDYLREFDTIFMDYFNFQDNKPPV